jgi:hypothetical protein
MSRYLVMPSPAQLGTQIVTSGLVGYWDAGNSASYPGTGTTWTDLSGSSRTGTLVNGPTYSANRGGILVLDGTDDFVSMTGSLTTSAATFVVWIRRNGTQPTNGGILFSRGAAAANGLNFYSTTHRVGYTWASAINTYTWAGGPVVTDATWCMVAVSISASNAVAYLYTSSTPTTATNSVTHGSSTIDALRVGDPDHGPPRCFKGDFGIGMVYSRALSQAELTQNFNATRWRFGL